jgi:hypothetical protein
MRSVIAVGLLIVLYGSASAAPVHSPRVRQHVVVSPSVRPGPGAAAPGRFAVPGWTDQQTEHWLDAATSCRGCGP